jgi:hypothetical protein
LSQIGQCLAAGRRDRVTEERYHATISFASRAHIGAT